MDDRVEDRLEVCRRAADDLQDLGGRGLLLQCLGSLPLCLGKPLPNFVSVTPCLGKLAGAGFELLLQSRD